ncbi:MAG TPA: hypothetical protein VFG10_15825 [Saprospiraceae bacterium]|nr:hypothetical protein [Saprospiraceae bacterium]
MDEIELTGKVIKKRFAAQSKSDHEAVFLDTGDKVYRLRKYRSNPFYNKQLHDLVGNKVRMKGKLTTHFFVVYSEPEIIRD